MNIITSNPIIDEADFNEDDYYSNLFGKKAKSRRSKRRTDRTQKKATRSRSGGGFLDKLSSGAQKIAQSGILDAFGQGGTGGVNDGTGGFNDGMGATGNDFIPLPPPPPTGMSKGVKIALGVGIAAALGVGIYFLVKKGKKTAKKA